MNKVIVYIFGPKRLADSYKQNKVVDWVKIGLTKKKADVDPYEGAMERIMGEVRTGIPEICRLYDVAEFPYTEQKIDDKIRENIINEYDVENSKSNNSLITDSLEIRAGNEFIYNVKKTNIHNGIIRYYFDLLFYNTDDENVKNEIREYMKTFAENINTNELDETDNDNENSKKNNKKCPDIVKEMYDAVKSKCIPEIKQYLKPLTYKPYFSFSKNSDRWISCSYSIRENSLKVGTIFNSGLTDEKLEEIKQVLIDNNLSDFVFSEGVKNPNWKFFTYTYSLNENELNYDIIVDKVNTIYNVLKDYIF